MMAKILSQEEIDALLSTVSSGDEDVEQAQESLDSKSATAYDFKHPNRVSKDQIRTLENIHNNFAGHLGSSVSVIQRAVVDVDLMSVDQITYSEFIMSLTAPSYTYTYDFKATDGVGIIDFNPSLTFAFVDRMFGGPGRSLETEREFTGIERAVMSPIVDRALRELSKAWSRILSVEIEKREFETNPQFVQIVPPGETVIVITFQLKMLQSSGILTICYPYVTLEPIVERLSGQNWIDSKKGPTVSENRAANLRNLQAVETPVKVVLASGEMTVRDFLNVHVGDVVVCRSTVNDATRVLVGERLKYTGAPGRRGKHNAVRIVDVDTEACADIVMESEEPEVAAEVEA